MASRRPIGGQTTQQADYGRSAPFQLEVPVVRLVSARNGRLSAGRRRKCFLQIEYFAVGRNFANRGQIRLVLDDKASGHRVRPQTGNLRIVRELLDCRAEIGHVAAEIGNFHPKAPRHGVFDCRFGKHDSPARWNPVCAPDASWSFRRTPLYCLQPRISRSLAPEHSAH